MHPLNNGSQVENAPEPKPRVGQPGYFSESNDKGAPSYPGQDWFNAAIREFLLALEGGGIDFIPGQFDHLKRLFDTRASSSHVHDAKQITSGTLDNARLNKATSTTKGILSVSSSLESDDDETAASSSAVHYLYDLISELDSSAIIGEIPDASISEKGIVQLSNSFASSRTDRAATSYAVQLAVGTTFQNKSWESISGRLTNVNYTNSDNYPIQVSVSKVMSPTGGAGETFNLIVDGLVVADAVKSYGSLPDVTTLTAIIPPQSTYKMEVLNSNDHSLRVSVLR